MKPTCISNSKKNENIFYTGGFHVTTKKKLFTHEKIKYFTT